MSIKRTFIAYDTETEEFFEGTITTSDIENEENFASLTPKELFEEIWGEDHTFTDIIETTIDSHYGKFIQGFLTQLKSQQHGR